MTFRDAQPIGIDKVLKNGIVWGCAQPNELRDDGPFFFDVMALYQSDGSYNIECY